MHNPVVFASSLSARQRVQKIGLLVLLSISFLAVLRLAAPLWIGLVLGIMGGVSLLPLYRRLEGSLGPVGAGLSTTLLAAAGCVIPFVAVFYVMTTELGREADLLQHRLSADALVGYIVTPHSAFLEHLGINRALLLQQLDQVLSHAVDYATALAGFIVHTTTGAGVSLIVGLMTLYTVLLRWPQMVLRLESIVPLDPQHTRTLLSEFARVGRITLMGTVLTALAQGALGTIGFALARAPHAVLWGLLVTVASFVPIGGTALVWAPVSAYLLTTGHPAPAAFSAIWGLAVVAGTGEYIIRPRLAGGRNGTHPLLILVAVVGGVEALGIVGILLGPVIVSLFLTVLRIYESEGRAGASVKWLSRVASERPSSRRMHTSAPPARHRAADWRDPLEAARESTPGPLFQG